MATMKEQNEAVHKNRFIPGKQYRVKNTDIIFKFVMYNDNSELLFEGVQNTENYSKDPDNGYYPFSYGNSLEEVPE